MGQIHKFQKLGAISGIFQQIAPDRVCQQGGKALPNDAVPGQKRKFFGVQLAVQLVLAAGNGKIILLPQATALKRA